MAVLNGHVETFEITPLIPSPEGPTDAYRVRLCRYGDEIWNRQYNVEGWQAGHSEVYKIGKAFAYSRRLLDATIPLSLWHDSTDPEDLLPMQVYLSVLWLEVVLSGYRWDTQKHVTVNYYLWDGPDADYEPNVSPSHPLSSYRAGEISVEPEEAERFGKSLCAECRTAQVLRRELNMEHYDDHLDFN